jgi:hypothetical protein
MRSDSQLDNIGVGQNLRSIVLNILTVFFLIATCLCPAFSLMIFASPQSIFNPLPPHTATAVYIPPTSTNTSPYEFPPTWTPSNTPESSPTRTQPLPTQKAFYPFVVEGGRPVYVPSLKGCNWLGVVGTIYDLNHNPFDKLIIHLTGELNGKPVDVQQVTGSPGTDRHGEYELQLADRPILALNALYIEVLDANQTPLSEKLRFNTYEGCDRNEIKINFVQVSP